MIRGAAADADDDEADISRRQICWMMTQTANTIRHATTLTATAAADTLFSADSANDRRRQPTARSHRNKNHRQQQTFSH